MLYGKVEEAPMQQAEGLVIDPQFKSHIRLLKPEERDTLEKNILADGCRDALIVWRGENILLDGHNRYAICTQHNLSFRIEYKDFEHREDALDWLIDNQLGRRNLTKNELDYYIGKKYNRLKQQGKRTDLTSGNFYQKLQTSETLAGEHGVSEKTVRNDGKYTEAVDRLADSLGADLRGKILSDEIKASREEIQELAKDPEKAKPIIEAAIAQNIPLKEAKKEVKKQERAEHIETVRQDIAENKYTPPSGLYNVIVIDPPWPYGTEYDPNGRRVANPYPEMSLEEIEAIQLPAAENCILWLWTTHKFMRHSFRLLDTWGFRDVSILTWVKNRMATGSWLRSQSEFCIMAVKGKPLINLSNQTTVLHGELREHSRKPDSFYEMVDGLCVGFKLDWFARESRSGWAVFGAEQEKFSNGN